MTLTVLIQQISAGPILPIHQNRPTAIVEDVDAEDYVPMLQITDVDSDNVSSEINARIHKRHLDYVNEMNSRELEWVNPCGGSWDETLPSRRLPVKRILGKLQNDTIIERKTLRVSATLINIREIRMWSKHKEAYKFLPVLKLNSNVALRRWHRQMQLFVGSFAYLRRAQLQWDYAKAQHESEISKELLKLKQSARSILCEIESAINNTSAHGSTSGGNAHKHQHNKKRLNFLTRDAMGKKLKFRTNLNQLYETPHKRHHHHQLQQQPELTEVNPIDLIFAKYRYFNYLRSMVRVVRTHIRRPGRVTLDSRSASSASASAQASAQASALADSLTNSSSSSELSHTSNSVEMVAQRSKNHSRQNSSNTGRNVSNLRRNNSSRKNGGKKPNQSRQKLT